jgi:hypothetical protein
VLTLWAAVVAERLGFARSPSRVRPRSSRARRIPCTEHFRPAVPPGARGWGAAGTLDLEAIKRLAKSK